MRYFRSRVALDTSPRCTSAAVRHSRQPYTVSVLSPNTRAKSAVTNPPQVAHSGMGRSLGVRTSTGDTSRTVGWLCNRIPRVPNSYAIRSHYPSHPSKKPECDRRYVPFRNRPFKKIVRETDVSFAPHTRAGNITIYSNLVRCTVELNAHVVRCTMGCRPASSGRFPWSSHRRTTHGN